MPSLEVRRSTASKPLRRPEEGYNLRHKAAVLQAGTMRNTPQPPSITRLGSVTDLMSMVRVLIVR